MLWTRSGKVIPLKTARGQADGIAEATNGAGMTVGYLGNQSKTEPEMDRSPCGGPERPRRSSWVRCAQT